jgi:hypothetical protein
MLVFNRIRDILIERRTTIPDPIFFSLKEQINAWHRANQIMGWGIKGAEFENWKGARLPLITDADSESGFDGIALFYGFGDDGTGNADSILSGKLAWEYVDKTGINKTWQCGYIDFCKPKDIRLRPGAPPRPKGFYAARINLGHKYKMMTVSQVLSQLEAGTGCGPEGLQFLSITHCHLIELMNKCRIPFMSLADYEVAPRRVDDFCDAPQIFCCDNRLGLGIGNVERNYPLFGIPTMHFVPNRMSSN